VLFENDRGADSSLEAMRFFVFDQLAKRSHARSSGLAIVRYRTKVALHFARRVQPLDHPPLSGRERVFTGSFRRYVGMDRRIHMHFVQHRDKSFEGPLA
jgi:hypothetical protein